jgi:hypothetical protein
VEAGCQKESIIFVLMNIACAVSSLMVEYISLHHYSESNLMLDLGADFRPLFMLCILFGMCVCVLN